MMEALTPASADGLPPLGELVADVPFWRYPSGAAAGEGVAHLRVWTTATVPQGHLAAVTETGAAASVTESAGRIWAELARERFGAKDPRSWRFKFHGQTSGVDLTREQPLNCATNAIVNCGIKREVRLAREFVDIEQGQRAARRLLRAAERIAIERLQERRDIERR